MQILLHHGIESPSPPRPHELRGQRWSRHGKRRRILSLPMGFSSDLQHPWFQELLLRLPRGFPWLLERVGNLSMWVQHDIPPITPLQLPWASPPCLVAIMALNHSQLITTRTLSIDNTITHQEVLWAFHWFPFMLTSSFWDYQLTGHSQS